MSDSPSAPTRSRRVLVGLLLIGALSCFLRLWPIEHGDPHPEYVPDTHVVKNALGMLSDKDPVPPTNKYSSYPYLLPYVLIPVYAADYGLGRLRGDWGGGEEYGNVLRENPWHAHLLARIVLALIAATAPLFVFFAARAAGMTAGAWIAAFLAATCLLHLQMSVQERPWAPMTAAVAATAWAAAVHAKTGTRKSLLWCGVAAGIAGALHQAGLPALLIAGIAWVVAPVHDDEGNSLGWSFPGIQRRVVRGFLCVALFAVVTVAIGHPYLVRYGLTDPSQLVVAPDDPGGKNAYFSFGAQQVALSFRLATLPSLSWTFLGYDPVILVLGVLGLGIALRRRELIPATVFVLAWGAFFMTSANEHTRYLLPMAILMSLPAALLLERVAKNPAGIVLVALLLAVPLVQSVRFGMVMRQADTRQIASEQLASLPRDARVAIDVYGPVVPMTLEALNRTEKLRALQGSALYGREVHRRTMLEAGAPQVPGIDAVKLEDVFDYELRFGGTAIREGLVEEYGETTEDVLASLGITHLLLVDRTPDDGVPAPLADPNPSLPHRDRPEEGPMPKLAPLQLPDSNVWTIHPSWSDPMTSVDGTAVDARLPKSLDFPLRDLWSVRRPGPKLQLFELPRD